MQASTDCNFGTAVNRRAVMGRGAALAVASMTGGPAFAQGAQTIRIALVRATVCAPALLVGRYLPAGWKVETTPFSSPGDQTNALLTDSMDVAYTGLTAGIVARSRDQPITIVANGAGKGTGIVVGTNSPIRSVADLKGRKVGNLPLSIHDVLLREELRKAGLKLDDVTAIRLAPADMPAALQRGDIEAFSGNEPNVTATIMAGYGRVLVYPYENPVGTINVGVLSSETAAQKKPEMMKIWGEAHAKATEQLAADPELWADLVTKEWGYDRAAARESMKNIQLVWRIDPAFKSQLSAYTDRLKELGVISRIPDLGKLVNSAFVDPVRL